MAGWAVVPNPDISAWKPVQQTPEAVPTTGRLNMPIPAATERPGTAHPAYLPQDDLPVDPKTGNRILQATSKRDELGSIFPAVGMTAGGLLGSTVGPVGTAGGGALGGVIGEKAKALYEGKKLDPVDAVKSGALGALGGPLEELPGAFSELGQMARGNPDEAALRGLQMGARSPQTLKTLRSIEGARPYLEGANNLEDLQARIPGAKQEIWNPYQETVNAIGPRPVQGPDGLMTIQDLENERLQLSALNRGLKARNPEAIQLAQQKGMTQADLLDREEAVKSALDPHLQNAGIDPQEIRSRFGNVAQIGSRISGKSTLLEPSEPSGLGRMLNMRIDNPRSWIGEPAQGARDLIAGRPLWSAKPTDLGIQEGFRIGGEKPNLGRLLPQDRLQLPSQVPFREGEEPVGPWQFGVPTGGQVTPAPEIFPRLAARAGEGETQPMLLNRAPSHPGVAEPFSRERIRPTPFSEPEILPARGGRLTPEGQLMPGPRGLLPSGAPKGLFQRGLESLLPLRGDEDLQIWPKGSQFQGEDEAEFYPHGSKYRRSQ